MARLVDRASGAQGARGRADIPTIPPTTPRDHVDRTAGADRAGHTIERFRNDVHREVRL